MAELDAKDKLIEKEVSKVDDLQRQLNESNDKNKQLEELLQ